MADSHSSGDYSDVVSRREFVSLAGATGAAAVAGCLGGGGGGDSEDLWFLGTQTDFSAADYNWNPTIGWLMPHDSFGMFAQFAQYQIGEDNFVPHLITDWSHDGGEMTLTMSEDFTWASGDSVTAEDLVLEFEIREEISNRLFDFVTGYEASGEYELTLSYDEGINTDLIDYVVLAWQADLPPSNWEDSNWEEGPLDVTIEEPDSSGPVHLTDHNDQYSQTEVRDGLDDAEDHHLASNYNWNGYRVEYRDGNNSAHQSFINNDVDGQHTLFVNPETLDQFPDTVEEFQIPGAFGMGLWFDHSHDVWSQREARQALMYSMNRDAIILQVSEASKIPHPANTGLSDASIEDWLGSREPDGFNIYEADTEMADSLLSEIDTSKDDIGEVAFTFPAGWSDWATGGQAVVDQLNQNGWNAAADSRESGPGTYSTADDWEMCADQHTLGGTPAMNLPYYSLRYKINNRERNADQHFANYLVDEDTVEIDGEEIDPIAELEAFTEATDRSEQEEIVERLAMVVNKDLPVGIIMEKYEQALINTDRFEIPDESPHFQSYWPMWWLPKVDETMDGYDEPGLMKATGDD